MMGDWPKKYPPQRSQELLVGLALLVQGCAAVGPDYVRPEIPAPTTWSAKLDPGLVATVLKPGDLVQWWEEEVDPASVSKKSPVILP